MVENARVCRSGSSLLKELAQVKDASCLQDLAVVCTDGVVFTHRLIISALSPTIAASLVDVRDPCLILPDNSTFQLKQVIARIFTPQECEDKMPSDLIESLHWVDFSRARSWHIAGVTNKQVTWPTFFMKDSPSKRANIGTTHGLDGFSEEFSQFAAAAVNLNHLFNEMESNGKVTELTETRNLDGNNQQLLEIKLDFNKMSSATDTLEKSATNVEATKIDVLEKSVINNDSSPSTEVKEVFLLAGHDSENNNNVGTSDLGMQSTAKRENEVIADMEIQNTTKDEINTIDLSEIALSKPIVKTIPMDVELENLTLPKDDTSVVSRVHSVFLTREPPDLRQDNCISRNSAEMACMALKEDCISPNMAHMTNMGLNDDCISPNMAHKGIDWDEYSMTRLDGKRQCKLCPKSFSKEVLLRNHVTTSHISKVQDIKNNTQCTTCGKILYDKHSLRKHENAVHLKIKAFSCEICCKKFAIKNDLRDHIQAVHDKVKACICDLCGLPLATRHGLRMHRLIHQENTKNINCDKCNKSFRHMSTFKKHISRVHEFKPENRLQCPHCDKLYNHDEGLQRHVKKFHAPVNSNKFVCNSCTAAFAYNYDLNKHKKRFHKPEDLSNNPEMPEPTQSLPTSPNDVKRIPIPRLKPCHNKNTNSSFNMECDPNQIEQIHQKETHSNHIVKVELPNSGQLIKDTIYIVKDMATGQNITLREQLEPVNMDEFGMESDAMGMSIDKETSVCQRISFNPPLPMDNVTTKQTIQTILGQ